MTESNNPLRRFFRQPAVYIKLPSEGNFYPPGAIDIPPNGEFPIYAMTAMDEITYRTSDALFNGTAIINVIKSCVPNILDPWKIPNIDMDTLLVAIRIASYGHAMDFESSCPHCEHENSFGLDLRTILDGMGKADYGNPMQSGDITIFFKPLTYQQVNANSIDQFADQKLLETLPDANVPEEEKMRLLTGAFNKLTDMTMRALTQSISMMQVMEETVVEPEYIEEFIRNCDRDVFNRIRDHIVSLRSSTELKPLKLQCQGCQKDYETPFTMDVSNFFGSAS
jgi:hypothetical protein